MVVGMNEQGMSESVAEGTSQSQWARTVVHDGPRFGPHDPALPQSPASGPGRNWTS